MYKTREWVRIKRYRNRVGERIKVGQRLWRDTHNVVNVVGRTYARFLCITLSAAMKRF